MVNYDGTLTSSHQIITNMQTRSDCHTAKVADKIRRGPCADYFCQIEMERSVGKLVIEIAQMVKSCHQARSVLPNAFCRSKSKCCVCSCAVSVLALEAASNLT